MKLKSSFVFANPRDDEEDNVANFGCDCGGGVLFSLSRLPGQDDVDLFLGDDDDSLRDFKVTLGAAQVRIETAPGATDLFKGDEVLEIDLSGAFIDLDEARAALQVILDGTGTFVSEL